MSKLFGFTAVVLSLSLVAACGGPSGPTKADRANDFNAKLQTALPGIVVTTAKLDSARGGNWVVVAATSGGTTQYLSVNLDLITTSMNAATIIATLTAAGASGYENVTKTGTYGNFYISAAGNVYEETQGVAKDLEKTAAAIEAVQYTNLAQSISANYGLSEDRSFEVAKLSMQWTKLAKSRSMTDADAEAFSKDLVGFNVADAEAAYAKAQAGDASSFNALMTQAAAANGVSPEQMNKIVAEVIAN